MWDERHIIIDQMSPKCHTQIQVQIAMSVNYEESRTQLIDNLVANNGEVILLVWWGCHPSTPHSARLTRLSSKGESKFLLSLYYVVRYCGQYHILRPFSSLQSRLFDTVAALLSCKWGFQLLDWSRIYRMLEIDGSAFHPVKGMSVRNINSDSISKS